MKRAALLLMCVVALCSGAYAQERAIRESTVRMEYGPLAGATYVLMEPPAFNTRIQKLYPNDDASYFPLFSEIGVFAKQLTKLGDTDTYLTFQEMLLFGGLDQNMAMPTLRFLLGFESRLGMEFAVGPYVAFNTPEDGTQLRFSFAYVVGWTLSNEGVSIPVYISFVPYPSYWQPRFSLITGFSFKVAD